MGPERKAEQRRATCAQDGAASSRGGVYHPRNPRASPLWRCAQRHSEELREAGRFQRAVEESAIEHFIACGDPHHGFARIYCDACRHEFLIAYSCKTRHPARPQSRQKFLNRSGASSMYRTVCWIFLWPR
jgi:hypothetical protein